MIPKRYARVLLHAIYLDTVDLSLILRGGGCAGSSGSLGEVRSILSSQYTFSNIKFNGFIVSSPAIYGNKPYYLIFLRFKL